MPCFNQLQVSLQTIILKDGTCLDFPRISALGRHLMSWQWPHLWRFFALSSLRPSRVSCEATRSHTSHQNDVRAHLSCDLQGVPADLLRNTQLTLGAECHPLISQHHPCFTHHTQTNLFQSHSFTQRLCKHSHRRHPFKGFIHGWKLGAFK